MTGFGPVSAGFVRLWIGTTASGLATWALPFILGLIVLEGLLTAWELGVVLGVRTVGFLLAVPVSGVLSDRLGPRLMILASGLAAAVGMPLMILGLGITGDMGLASVLLGSILAGIGQGACRPAYQAMIPLIVNPDRLQAANAAMTISIRVATLLGPAAATGISFLFSGRLALFCIAALWLVSSVVPPHPAAHIRRPVADHDAGAARRFIADMADGLREARRHPWFLAGLTALTCVIATGYSVAAVLLPALSADYHGSAVLLTGCVTAYTLGALAGGVLITRWRPVNGGWTALAGLSVYGFVPFSLLGPFHISIPIAVFFVAGIGIELFNVPWFTAVQREIPTEKLSRVSSLDFLCSYGLAPLGLSLLAPLATAFGTAPVLVCCGLLSICAPIAAMAIPTTRHFSSK